jgi:hypothetical protein
MIGIGQPHDARRRCVLGGQHIPTLRERFRQSREIGVEQLCDEHLLIARHREEQLTQVPIRFVLVDLQVADNRVVEGIPVSCVEIDRSARAKSATFRLSAITPFPGRKRTGRPTPPKSSVWTLTPLSTVTNRIFGFDAL